MKHTFLTLCTAAFFTSLAASSAQAQVYANPSFLDFGTVPAGQTRSSQITFQNSSSRPIPSFNVNCLGDLNFMCNTTCFALPAFGSCNVTIFFQPRSNDGMRRTMNVSSYGSGVAVQVTVAGTDASPTPTPSAEDNTTPAASND